MEIDPVIRDLSIGLSFKPQESCACTHSYGLRSRNIGLLLVLLLCMSLISNHLLIWPLISPLILSVITADTSHFFTKTRTKSSQ